MTVMSETDARVATASRRSAMVWLSAAAVASVVVPLVLGASLPLLTMVWLTIAVGTLRRGGTSSLGLVGLPRGEFLRVSATTTAVMTVLFGIAEFVGHPYRELLELVEEESTPDSTFVWVTEYGGGWGLVGFAIYGGLVTMFAEETVFRGALMNRLRRRGPWVAIGGTTVAFAAVQALPAALLPLDAAMAFLVIDAVLAVGLVGGFVAHRTGSIYPALCAVTVANVATLALVT